MFLDLWYKCFTFRSRGAKSDFPVSGQVSVLPNFSKVFFIVFNLYFLVKVKAHDALRYHMILPSLFRFDAKLKKFRVPYIFEL